jgi:two-component system chemotaxis response regulator CheY
MGIHGQAGTPQPVGVNVEGLRTLIVDDSSVMRKIVARALQQGGVSIGEILEAGNGVEALDILRRQRVDLVLSDINMPVMDGLEFVRQLQSVDSAKGIPVVMITTEGSESHVMQAISCGARGYIRKPFTPDQMKQHVLPLLQKG